MKILFALLLFTLLGSSVLGQDMDPFKPSGEAKYYDFWEGNWIALKEDGSIDSNATSFKISKSVHNAAWSEAWYSLSGKNALKASALRAWDKTNEKWMYVWISENGLFQVWDGKKVDNHWYFYKEFDIKGDKYLSRQGWIPVDQNKVMRISQKSYDQGKTWELRFKIYYQRM